jgi:6-phosphogluconate dehydrogenase
VAVYNRTAQKTRELVQGPAAGGKLLPAYSLPELVGLLRPPRRILLMVKAGPPVDQLLAELAPLLGNGDILIDGGNSFFQDTIRRGRALADRGLRYLGTGISGGEEGALRGASIMPGGPEEAYEAVRPVLESIAARVDGEPCCAYIGADGSGHYVKMVHNGIEYGDMQLIGEAYLLLKALGLGHREMQEAFAEWNRGELDSYLIQITADILGKADAQTGKPLVEMILDRAAQKGTGRWTSQSALELGVPAPTIVEAVFARSLSALEEERLRAASLLSGPPAAPGQPGERGELVESIRQALYASKICSYAQGFALLAAAAKEHGWALDPGRIAMIWRGGCIIRAKFLGKIKEAYDRAPGLANLLLDPYFSGILRSSQDRWRQVVVTAVRLGVPIPAFCSSISYYDAYRSERLGANLIQAQRDYFGAHTYERIDRPGTFHTDWTS